MCNVTMQLHVTPLIMLSNIYMQSNLLRVVPTWNIINNVQQNYFSSEQLPAIPLILNSYMKSNYNYVIKQLQKNPFNCIIQQLHKTTLIMCKTCTNRYMRNHELSETDIQQFDCVIRDLHVT